MFLEQRQLSVQGVRLMQHIETLEHIGVTARRKEVYAGGPLERWSWLIRNQPPIPPIRKLSFLKGQVCQIMSCELTFQGKTFGRSAQREELLEGIPGLVSTDAECLDLWTDEFRLNIWVVPGATQFSLGSIPLEAEWASLFAAESEPGEPI